jgi:hypothetical protein
MFPGDTQNVGFAITNPNAGSVYVTTVTIGVATDPANGFVETIPGNTYSDVSGCYANWFTINGSPVTVDANISTGTTQFGAAASITFVNEPWSQDACEGATFALTFTSP